MKAQVDGALIDANYKNMQQSQPIQTNHAKELHHLAAIP